MKVTLTKMEKNAVSPKYIVHTRMYSDLAYDVCKAYIAYDNGAVNEVDYKAAMRMPDGEVVFAFQHAAYKMFPQEKACNYKTWREETAKSLIRFIRRSLPSSYIFKSTTDLRKLDAMIVQYKTEAYMDMPAAEFNFNVAAAMYMYDVLLDHTKAFSQYNEGFAEKMTGMELDPVTAEAIGAVKARISELGKSYTAEIENVKDMYYHMKQQYAEECDKRCKAEIDAMLAEYGNEAETLMREVNSIA